MFITTDLFAVLLLYELTSTKSGVKQGSLHLLYLDYFWFLLTCFLCVDVIRDRARSISLRGGKKEKIIHRKVGIPT